MAFSEGVSLLGFQGEATSTFTKLLTGGIVDNLNHVCTGCKYLQKSWRKGNMQIIKWICGRYKQIAEYRCIDFAGKHQ